MQIAKEEVTQWAWRWVQSALTKSRWPRCGCGRPPVDMLPADLSKTATALTWGWGKGVGILIFLPCFYYVAERGGLRVLMRWGPWGTWNWVVPVPTDTFDAACDSDRGKELFQDKRGRYMTPAALWEGSYLKNTLLKHDFLSIYPRFLIMFTSVFQQLIYTFFGIVIGCGENNYFKFHTLNFMLVLFITVNFAR